MMKNSFTLVKRLLQKLPVVLAFEEQLQPGKRTPEKNSGIQSTKSTPVLSFLLATALTLTTGLVTSLILNVSKAYAQTNLLLPPTDGPIGLGDDGVIPAGYTFYIAPAYPTKPTTPDVMDVDGVYPFFGGFFVGDLTDMNGAIIGASPQGGTMGIFASEPGGWDEGWSRQETGLTPGETYAIAFVWQPAIFNQDGVPRYVDGALNVAVNGTLQNYTYSGPGWQTDTYTFVAPTSGVVDIDFYIDGSVSTGDYGGAIVFDGGALLAIAPTAGIDVTKEVTGTALAASGTAGNYDLTYKFVIENTVTDTLDKLTLTEDFATQFGGAFVGVVGTPTIVAGTGAVAPTANGAFDGGASDANVFDGTSGEIEAGETITVTMVVEVDPDNATAVLNSAGELENSATAGGADPNGDPVTDDSDDPNNATDGDPDGDGNPDDPTSVLIADKDGDGVMDADDLDDDNDGILDGEEGDGSSINLNNAFANLQPLVLGGTNATGTIRTIVNLSNQTATDVEFTVSIVNSSTAPHTFTPTDVQKQVVQFGRTPIDTASPDSTPDAFTIIDYDSATLTVAAGLTEDVTLQELSTADNDVLWFFQFNNAITLQPGEGLQTTKISFPILDNTATSDLVFIPDCAGGTRSEFEVSGTNVQPSGIAAGDDCEPGSAAQSLVPESLDTEADGVFDYLDLDSDNDGISDLYESGASAAAIAADANNDGTVSLAESLAAMQTNLPAYTGDGDADNDGLMDVVDANFQDPAATASVGTVPTDSDTDGDEDYLDLDSDGDGIPDTIEARPTAGYVANDGNVADDDADGDGILTGSTVTLMMIRHLILQRLVY